jgi:hypothetical protein
MVKQKAEEMGLKLNTEFTPSVPVDGLIDSENVQGLTAEP